MKRMQTIGLGLLLGFSLPAARAEVVEASPQGFLVRHLLTIDAPPERVYAAIGEIGRWWNPAHSWSGDSSNMSLDLRVGGCFCEKLEDGGGVQHMTVVFASPGNLLRLTGALGPLQGEPLAGVQSWYLKPKDKGTELAMTYSAGGFTAGGDVGGTWARPVDGVLLEQLTRFKRYVETGKAEAPKP